MILLVNPNSSPATTAAMAGLVRSAAPHHRVEGFTNDGAPSAILDAPGLEQAQLRLLARIGDPAFTAAGAIIVAAFADPCLEAIRARHPVPVAGIAEAGMAAAAAGGRRFAVVTTTPGLAASIDGLAAAYGHAAGFAGVELTPGDPAAVMADPARLATALAEACERAVRGRGAEAIVIGGGPLAVAARAIAADCPVPLVEPVPEAARLVLSRLQASGRP